MPKIHDISLAPMSIEIKTNFQLEVELVKPSPPDRDDWWRNLEWGKALEVLEWTIRKSAEFLERGIIYGVTQASLIRAGPSSRSRPAERPPRRARPA